MIVNMAISDLLFPIFLFPLNLVEMQAKAYWWFPSSDLVQDKLFSFNRFCDGVDSEPDSDNSASIWSCCDANPRLSTHQ